MINCYARDKALAIAAFIVFMVILIVFSWASLYRMGYQDAYSDYKNGTIDRPENIDCLIAYEKGLIDKKYKGAKNE